MAIKSKIVMNERRKKLVAKYLKVRLELKDIIRKPTTSYEDREEAQRKLRKLPRNSQPNRVQSRCHLTGRPRGVYRKFGLSRIALRERAMKGQLPGVTKASW